jgi:hypothetical protein
MFNSKRIALWLIVLGLALGTSSALTAEESADKSPALDMKGKVVMLMVDYSSALEDKRSSEYLMDAVVQEIGGRYFITGRAYSLKEPPKDSPIDWRKGAHIGIAWDKVQQFYIFAPEQMEEIIKKRVEERDE